MKRELNFDLYKQFPAEDKELYEKMQGQFASEEEKEFFEKILAKEIYDFPVSTFDVIMDEGDNEDGIYIEKHYHSEYKVAQVKDGKTRQISLYPESLSDLLKLDMFELLGQHITVFDWLRKRNYSNVRYDYPWES